MMTRRLKASRRLIMKRKKTDPVSQKREQGFLDLLKRLQVAQKELLACMEKNLLRIKL
jgi:hypothetical protein